jgi:hypothetical protein
MSLIRNIKIRKMNIEFEVILIPMLTSCEYIILFWYVFNLALKQEVRIMKRFFIAATVLAVMVSGGLVLAQQQGAGQGQGYGPQGQGWFCPWGGQNGPQGQGMGPGMMRGQGMKQGQQGMMRGGQQGMMHGQGMHRGQQGMHQGWGRGQYGPQGGQQQQPAQPLQADQARQLAENYVAGNPNLKVGEVTDNDAQGTFVATIVTQDGSLVEKVLIDKETGWMKRQY